MPYQQATETPGRESTVQLRKKKRGLSGREPDDQAQRVPPPQGQTKQQFEMLRVESFTAGTAEPRMVQLGGGEGVHHYRGNLPQLRYTPIADAASHC